MSVGMAGVAGTILAAYAGLLGERYLPYLLAAAFMSAPGGILMAKLIMPDEPAGADELTLKGGAASKSPEDEIDVHTFEEGERPGQHHHGGRSGRADRRQAGGCGRRDGAGVRRAGGAGQRHFGRHRRLVRSAGPVVPGDRRHALLAGDVPDRRSVERSGGCRRTVRHQDRPQRIRRLHRPRQCRGPRRGAERAQPGDLASRDALAQGSGPRRCTTWRRSAT